MRFPIALLALTLVIPAPGMGQLLGQDTGPPEDFLLDSSEGAVLRSPFQPERTWSFVRDTARAPIGQPEFDVLRDTPSQKNLGGEVFPEMKVGLCFGFSALTGRHFRDTVLPAIDAGDPEVEELRLRRRFRSTFEGGYWELEQAALEQMALWDDPDAGDFGEAWENLGQQGRQRMPLPGNGGQMRSPKDLAERVLGDLQDRSRAVSVLGVMGDYLESGPEGSFWKRGGHALLVFRAFRGKAVSSDGQEEEAVAFRIYDSNYPERSRTDRVAADATQLLLYLPRSGMLTFDEAYLQKLEAEGRAAWQRPQVLEDGTSWDGTFLLQGRILYSPIHSPGLFDRPAQRMRERRGLRPRL